MFGSAGMLVSYLSAGISKHLSPEVLLVAFALLMLGIGIMLLFRRAKEEETSYTANPLLPVVVSGAGVGLLTGILGVGGGFLVVPALVMLLGLPVQVAVPSGMKFPPQSMLYNGPMATQILATKLYIPSPLPKVVARHHLIEQLNHRLSTRRSVTLMSAPGGFGKTTLVTEWIASLTSNPASAGRVEGVRAAWLSLDERDNDLARFLIYFIRAVQTIAPNLGAGLLEILQSAQPSPIESILTTLLHEITAIPDDFLFVLDDYHLTDAKAIDDALAFVVDHLPAQMHLVITTREDPALPIPRLMTAEGERRL
jgi:hypothetical protein